MDPVTEALRGRMQLQAGMERMVVVSLAGHIAVLAAVALLSPGWRGAQTAPREVMTISLGGAVGPETTGMTPIAGRPVQRAVEPTPRPPALRAPTARAPEMTVPVPTARPRAESREAETEGAPRSRTPTTGEQVQEGSAVAQTTGRGSGFGLSSGGGQGSATATLDVGNFCCPEYVVTMQQTIRRNWNERQTASGEAIVKFTILRDGTLRDIELERSSGDVRLDLEAQRALGLTRRLAPLPAPFPDESLTVHLTFRY
jgi:TonB family protein